MTQALSDAEFATHMRHGRNGDCEQKGPRHLGCYLRGGMHPEGMVMIGNPERSTIRVAGLLLYPLPGNCVLEYDDATGRRRVMLLSEHPDEIAALQRAWREPGAAAWFRRDRVDIEALRWMDSHRPLPAPPPDLKTNPAGIGYDRRVFYLLGWDFDARQSVIRKGRRAI